MKRATSAGVPEQLRRAFENVVRNAVTYTGDGTAVDVSLVREGSFAFVRIRDRGPGVPEASLADIFRPFFRIGQPAIANPAERASALQSPYAQSGHMAARSRPPTVRTADWWSKSGLPPPDS